MLISLSGLAGSGKDTAASFLVNDGFTRLAFADVVKDVIASVFGWDRARLNGFTPDDRIWREQPDVWWANKLGIDGFSPRRAMQLVGTDVFRDHLHPNIWVNALERQLLTLLDSGVDVVVTDARFRNELGMLSSLGAVMVRITRGLESVWYQTAMTTPDFQLQPYSNGGLANLHLHQSECESVGFNYNHIVSNDGTVFDLERSIRAIALAWHTIRP